MSHYKPQVATNRPVAQPIDIGLDAEERALIRSTAASIVRADFPDFGLRAYVVNASDRALRHLAKRVAARLNQQFDPTDVVVVLVTPHVDAGL